MSRQEGQGGPPHESERAAERQGPRGPYRNGLRTREQIVAQAMTAFSQRGFHGSSARQIAAAVGISPAAIRRHFDSKDDLLAAVLTSWAQRTADAQGIGEIAGLERWTSQHNVVEYHLEHRGLLQLFLRLVAEATVAGHPARAFMVTRYDKMIEAFAGYLCHAAETGDIAPITPDDARHEARALFAFMDGIEIQWMLDPSLDMVAEFDRYLAQVLERLGGRSPAG